MQTTTFRCGSCNNLMAVSNEYLGQQVQCPTCRQVVVAPSPVSVPIPAPAPEPFPSLALEPISPPAPEPLAPPPPQPMPAPTQALSPFPSLSLDTEHESIFSESTGDDLFDEPGPSLTPAPTVEYRPEAVPVLEVPPEPEPMYEPTSIPVPPLVQEAAPEPVSQRGNWNNQSDRGSTEISETRGDDLTADTDRRKRKAPGVSWTTLLFVPLLSYAVLATALLFYMWNRMEAIRTSVSNPIQFMPDVHGDAPGAKKQQSVSTWKVPDSLTLAALPPGHTIRLGEKIVVGNLEVEPLRVEVGKPSVKQGSFRPEPTINDTLMLFFRFRNLSAEYSFAPLDNCFDRKWTGVRVEKVPPLDSRPFTVLQAGSQNFFGGTPAWIPRGGAPSLKGKSREWVVGDGRDETPPSLLPGQSMESFITTNGDREGAGIVTAALSHKGDLLWRVQVRQGPVEVKGRSEPVPSTTVIGVSFKASDVKRP